MNKRPFNIIFLFLLIGIVTWIVLDSGEISDIQGLLGRTDALYILFASGLMLIYLLADSLIILELSNALRMKLNLWACLRIVLNGQFYSLITPFASGGQPAQIYQMAQDFKVNPGQATSLTINKFLVFQLTLTIYAFTMFILKFYFIIDSVDNAFFLIVLGLSVNILGILLIVIFSFYDKFIKKIIHNVLGVLHFFRIMRKRDEDTVNRHIEEYSSSLVDLFLKKRLFIKTFILTFIQLSAYFSVPFFIGKSLGLKDLHYLDTLALQALLYVIVAFIPTPGSSGASEGGFYILFKTIFTQGTLVFGMLLWRFFTYYGILLLGGSYVFIKLIVHRKHADSGYLPNDLSLHDTRSDDSCRDDNPPDD